MRQVPNALRRSLVFLTVVALACAAVFAGRAIENNAAHERSDMFWDALWVHAVEVEHYASWHAMAPASDVVLVGTIEFARYGRSRGNDRDGWAHYAHVSVSPDRILAGAEKVPSNGIVVEVMVPSERAIDVIERNEPGERVVLFLRDKRAEAVQLGLPPDMVALEDGFFRLVNQEAVVREIDGKVHVRSAGTELFEDWDGRPFAGFTDVLTEYLASGLAF